MAGQVLGLAGNGGPFLIALVLGAQACFILYTHLIWGVFDL